MGGDPEAGHGASISDPDAGERVQEGAAEFSAAPSLSVDGVAVGDTNIDEASEIPEVPFSVDRVRRNLAYASLGIFAATVLLGFFGAFTGTAQGWAQTKELLQIVIPVESIIIGGAVAFYYSSAKD